MATQPNSFFAADVNDSLKHIHSVGRPTESGAATQNESTRRLLLGEGT